LSEKDSLEVIQQNQEINPGLFIPQWEEAKKAVSVSVE